jgi:hypothetical protein
VSYNGSGVFNINTAGQPVVTGTVISSTAFNALTSDLGTGLSTAITKDGQTTATARIPFAQGINSSLVTDATSTTTGSIITAGGAGIAKSLYVGLAANIGGGVDKLTSATGVVSVASATAPTTGQVLTATSGTVATWQTPTVTSAATPTVLGSVYGATSSASVYTTSLGYQAATTNSAGTNITAIGYQSGYNTTAGPNTYLGSGSGQGNSSGTNNVAIGFRNLGYAGAGGAQSYNVAVGDQTLAYNTTGGSNVAVGYFALYANTTASNNTAVGYQSLYNNTGDSNTAYGYQAGKALTTGTSNTFLSMSAGASVTTGSNNVLVGNAIGNTPTALTTGSFNTLIGYSSGVSAAGVSGEMLICSGSYGFVGKGANTGYIAPNGGGVYQGNNSTTWSTTSDQRLKKNIVDNNIGLEKITAIQVRNFEYRLPEEVDAELKPTDAIKKEGVQLGVIAQELQLVLPDCVKTESTGVMSVNADNLTWYMVNAIKELKAEFDAYKLAHP